MDLERDGAHLRITSMNLCIIAPGGNLRYQGPLFCCGTILAITSTYQLAHHFLNLSLVWSLIACVLLTPLLAANASLLCAVVLMVLRPSLHEQYKRERMREFVDQSKDFDVLCLQECINMWFSTIYQDELLDLLRENGFLYFAETPRLPRFPAMLCNSGLLIVSKVPIVAYKSHIYSRQAWYDLFAVNRAVLYAELAPDHSSRVHVFTTHLAPGHEAIVALMNVDNKRWNLVKLENSDALAQTKELMHFVRECTKHAEGPDFILAGDLNFRGGSASYQAFVQSLAELGFGAQDVFAQRHPDGSMTWPPTFGNVNDHGEPAETLITRPADRARPKTLDYMFTNMSWVSEGEQAPRTVPFTIPDKPYKQVSDHQGITACINIGRGK